MPTSETLLADIRTLRRDCSLVIDEFQKLVQALRRQVAAQTATERHDTSLPLAPHAADHQESNNDNLDASASHSERMDVSASHSEPGPPPWQQDAALSSSHRAAFRSNRGHRGGER